MFKKLILPLGFCLGLGVLGLGFSSQQTGWEKMSESPYGASIRRMLVLDQGRIWILGTDKSIYRSVDGGKNFLAAPTLDGLNNGVNDLYSSPAEAGDIYAATDRGVYLSRDQGSTWKVAFNPTHQNERQCLSVLVAGARIYVGTKGGLFSKEITGGSWQRATGELGREAVFYIDQDLQYLYLATSSELFRLKKDKSELKKIFSVLAQEIRAGSINFDDEDNATTIQSIKTLAVSWGRPPRIYLATGQRIVVSPDAGETWQDFHSAELPLNFINNLIILDHGQGTAEAEPMMAVGTDRGAFLYNNGRWKQIYGGMETNRINFLTHDHTGNIYAATDSGIFFRRDLKALTSGESEHNHALMPSAKENLFKKEPSVQEVQKFVVDYAEVYPQKILAWRKSAQRRAWLPTLSVGLDRSATEIFHWDSGPNPDNLLKGRDFLDWDVSLSWDLGDIIWNPDQTSIDSRSKLMVELREGLLDQVTRLYFERRRLQMELLNLASVDASLRLEKEMRIEELTALIDGMTGGKFSQRIE